MKTDIEELLIWTYRNQKADLVVDRGLGLHEQEARVGGIALQGQSKCGCAAVEAIQALGVRVDGTGGCDALHEDAEVVHQVVGRLKHRFLIELVINHARGADRPDPLPGLQPRPVSTTNGKGQIRVRYEPWDKNRNYGWCPIEWTISMAAIEQARLDYTMWRDAVARVAATLRIENRLVKNIVTGPTAPVRPWESSLERRRT